MSNIVFVLICDKRFQAVVKFIIRCCLTVDKMEQISKVTNNAKKPKGKNKFQYGNYDRYYGYRSTEINDDPRLAILKNHKELFEKKTVLDIGCNAGALTLVLAKDFHVTSITGIDIDKKLIDRARLNLKNTAIDKETFVKFEHSNYVLKHENLLELEVEKYDVITCFSVTKWIHLNCGDEGLKLAFRRIYKQLKSGGKFILEAQDFKSYKRRKSLTDTIYKNYKSIRLLPKQFQEYLLGSEVGFSAVYELGVPEHTAQGFRRPITVYEKTA